jgi:predicted RNA-binding protein with PUA-like domain
MAKQYWLMKAEEEAYSIEQWKKDKSIFWDGVRNYTARNFMRDQMKKGDGMFFYYSNGKPSGIAAIGEVVKEGCPDHTAFDPKDIHFDEKSDPKKPTWYMVDVKFVKACKQIVSLDLLKKVPGLKNMKLFKESRLSVQPVTEVEWKIINRLIDSQE